MSTATIPQGPLTVGQEEAARLVGVSTRHFRKLTNAGLTPPPINLGGNLRRWHVATLEEWLRSGGVPAESAAVPS